MHVCTLILCFISFVIFCNSYILKLLVILFRSEFMLKVILTLQLVCEYFNEIHLAFRGLLSNLLSSQDNSVFPIFYFWFPIFGSRKSQIPFFVKVIWAIADFRYFGYPKRDTQDFVEIICCLHNFCFGRYHKIWKKIGYQKYDKIILWYFLIFCLTPQFPIFDISNMRFLGIGKWIFKYC